MANFLIRNKRIMDTFLGVLAGSEIYNRSLLSISAGSKEGTYSVNSSAVHLMDVTIERSDELSPDLKITINTISQIELSQLIDILQRFDDAFYDLNFTFII